ncbi:unnamed protein product [Urochloa humidicola]
MIGTASTAAHNVLEHMLLDDIAKPTKLPLSLLEAITDNFSSEQEIGRGGFAVVYKGMLGNGTVAVKKLSKTLDMHEKKFSQEVQCLLKVRHKNIVRFLGYCSDTQGEMADYEGKFVMADVRNRLLCFEFVPNGSLYDYITDASCGLEWRVCYQIIKGICEGLHYLHENHIVHLDLKPGNILLDDNMVPKIADFGLSRCFDENQSEAITSKLIGSTGYLAPEFYNGQITFKLDVYSLGVIVIEMLTGQKGYSTIENVLEIWKDRLQILQKETLLREVRTCAEIGIMCMDVNPENRPITHHIIETFKELGSTDEFIEAGLISTVAQYCQTTIDGGRRGRARGQKQVYKNQGYSRLAHERMDVPRMSDTDDEIEEGVAKVEQEMKGLIEETSNWFSALSSFQASNDGDASSTTNEGTLIISPNANGEFKPKITSWMRGALLGSGSFATVFEAITREGALFAVKEVSLLDQGSNAQQSILALEQEITFLSQFEHENIVQYHGTDKEECTLYIFMELVTQGSLASIYRKYKLRESQVSVYTRQILNGLVYLHKWNVVHRDIKCANILVHANGSVKLADFGLAKEMSTTNMLRPCTGSVYWMAPEVINPKKLCGPPADIWSLGCTVLEMLTRTIPFPNVKWTRALYMIGRGEQPSIPSSLSKEAQDFIGQCVRVDPQKRPSASQLLEHPFVNRPPQLRLNLCLPLPSACSR